MGLHVMAVGTGFFHTPMMESLPPELTAQVNANISFPAGLRQTAESGKLMGDIRENPCLNGTVIRFDGAVCLPQR